MVSIPAGAYVLLQRSVQDSAEIAVASFLFAAYSVANAEFLAFATAHPAHPTWQRSQVSRLFAGDAAANKSGLAPRRVASLPIMPFAMRPADLKLTGLVGTLRCCQLFSGLPPADLGTIVGFVQVLRLAKDEMLFHEGEASRGFYLVQAGALNVHRVNAAGKEQVIHVFRAGELLAEAALASPTGDPANARAVEPSTVLLLPKVPVLELIGRRPDLALRMPASMSAHLRVVVGALDDLTLKDVETRLLNWLVKQSRPARGGVIPLPGTKRVLAAELGTSSETLRGQGLLTVAARSIAVQDPLAVKVRRRRNLGEVGEGRA